MFEAKFPEDPGYYAVAKHLLKTGVLTIQAPNQKTAEKTVRNWRTLPHYQANVRLYRRSGKASPAMTAKLASQAME
jgi:hypothetical protein